ncbi:RidA family protein [uncultured Anaerotruncus sp.]|uniref:RidA family protein n=1 Tax=uncultured Anaerotruncus sp. TaxID=905011 RepID=UPI00280AC9BB|nr:RidA family protein [uncultured Anaerotruncus sp.]
MKELVVSKEVFITEDFSQAMRVGDVLYLSGITARNEKGEILEKDFEAQTVRIFKNIENILKEAGAVLDDVIKFTVYLKDINNLGKFRELRNQYFSAPRPPSTAVEVTGLVPGAIVEVEVIVDCGKR